MEGVQGGETMVKERLWFAQKKTFILKAVASNTSEV